ncbi:MAG: O-methyltransferase [Flammeovirgaceae bacterium]|jgi:caffeoyl-CoA O-methyltransferase|nr:O-methyltransferase [Flammeovirgaceae bacterium]
MEFIPLEIDNYARAHTSVESDLLKKIYRDTQADILMPRMVSGHLQGRFLSMISKMIQPSAILEIGTFTGYSAICLAEGLQSGGQIVTIDNNEELETRVRGYFDEAKLGGAINYLIGDASQLIPTLYTQFDLVFIDADKENYSLYYDLVFEKVQVGGFIIADNVLWSGKVIQKKLDKDTQAIASFNEKVAKDGRVSCMLLPLRDGLMLIQKIKN